MCFLSLFSFSSFKNSSSPFCFYFLGVGLGPSFSRLGSVLPSWGWPFLLRGWVGPSFLLLFFSSFVNVSLIFDASWTISTPKGKEGEGQDLAKRGGGTTRGKDGEGQAPSKKGEEREVRPRS